MKTNLELHIKKNSDKGTQTINIKDAQGILFEALVNAHAQIAMALAKAGFSDAAQWLVDNGEKVPL